MQSEAPQCKCAARLLQAFMLRRIESGPVAKVACAVAEVLASCEAKGVISSRQRHALTAEIAGRLQNVL
jgi:hypothetical protein